MKIKRKTKLRHQINIKPRSKGQSKYLDSIGKNIITLCSGYAGTGKTALAIAAALGLVQDTSTKYNKVIIVRPAVEACGESLGYLPGSINDKMRPLIEPVLDNLRFLIKDRGYIASLLEGSHKNAPLIEVIPMAFLRGRNFHNCVVILDEAQNTSIAQMKLFLTRIGQNCKVIIEGDVTQSDLYKDRNKNGLMDAIVRLHDCEGVGVVCLEASDIQRNPIIAEIIKRYD